MKKLVFMFLVLFGSEEAFALPVGLPTEASLMCEGVVCTGYCGDYCDDPCLSWCDAWSVRIGFYGDYVFNRHLQVDSKHNRSDIEDAEIFTNAGYLALNFFNRADVFTSLGASNYWIRTPASSFGLNNVPIIIQTETDFSWSVGARGTLWECGCFGLGLEGQYFSTCPEIEFVRQEGGVTRYLTDRHLKYHEWQIGIGISYQINIACCSTSLIPYAAVKWARGKVDMDNFVVNFGASEFPILATFNDLETEKDWGYAVGVTLLGCNRAAVTVEARFADEKALYVNGQFRF